MNHRSSSQPLLQTRFIAAVGAEVAQSRVGQRVAIAWLGWACGTCEFCVSGHETLCESQEMSGYTIDGAYAEYAVASSAFVVPCPKEFPRSKRRP